MSQTQKSNGISQPLKAVLGIDLGGSNIFSVAWDLNGQRLAHCKLDTNARSGYDAVLNRIKKSALNISEQLEKTNHSIHAAGLCAPGVVRSVDGIITSAPNLGWDHVNPVNDLKNAPVFKELQSFVLMNDVNAGLLGEISFMKNPPQHAIGVFCGTGIGGAVYLNGKLHTGAFGGAGEIGHIVIRAGGKKQKKGINGSLESWIGKWALNQKIQNELAKKSSNTILKKLITYNLNKTPIKSSTLKKAFQKDDPFTIKLMNYYAKFLGISLSQAANMLEPQMVILGGGIIEALGQDILPVIEKNLKSHCMVQIPKLQISQSGDDAGPRGVALRAAEGLK